VRYFFSTYDVLAAERRQRLRGRFGKKRLETFGVGDSADVNDNINWRCGLSVQPLDDCPANGDASNECNSKFVIGFHRIDPPLPLDAAAALDTWERMTVQGARPSVALQQAERHRAASANSERALAQPADRRGNLCRCRGCWQSRSCNRFPCGFPLFRKGVLPNKLHCPTVRPSPRFRALRLAPVARRCVGKAV
jgi:hypothetical protein